MLDVVGSFGSFCHPWHKPLCGAVSGAVGLSGHPSQQVGFFHCFLDAEDMVEDQIRMDKEAGREPLAYDPQFFYDTIVELMEQDAE